MPSALPVHNSSFFVGSGVLRGSSCATFTLTLLVAAIGLAYSYHPLWYTDIWGHLAYGRFIVKGHRIPSTEPLMPLARGVPFDDSAWLSKVLGYLAYRVAGIEAMSFLHGSAIALALGLMARIVFAKTRSVGASVLAVLVCLALEWQQFLIARPQLAGLACFLLALACLCARRLLARPLWIFATFGVWANLHGSFLAGLAVVAGFVGGRGLDLLRRTRSLRAVSSDSRWRQYVACLLLGVLGVLINPYGWRIYSISLQTASNPNLSDIIEWLPLSIHMKQAQAAAPVALALTALYCFTPRRISAIEVLLLFGLGGLTLSSARMMIWWGPVAAYCVAIHAAAIARRWRRRRRDRPALGVSQGRNWLVAAVAVVLLAMALSPVGLAALFGVRRDIHRSLAAKTPIDVTNYLNAHPPAGLVFNSYEWGDYLLWAGPPGLPVFVDSHAHLVPHPVWHDYMRVIGVERGWQSILDHYHVTTVVLDADQHEALAAALSQDRDWAPVYEDDVAVVYVRRR